MTELQKQIIEQQNRLIERVTVEKSIPYNDLQRDDAGVMVFLMTKGKVKLNQNQEWILR